jgi:hypothetical protein
MLLTLEAAGCKMSQGLVGDAQAMTSAADARLNRTSPDLKPIHIAMLDIFNAFSTYLMTAKFKQPLNHALACYTSYGLDKEVRDFDKHTVSLMLHHAVSWFSTSTRSSSQPRTTTYWEWQQLWDIQSTSLCHA